MSPPSLPRRADPELLLEHAGWMRVLARGLVGDAERAEDLSQETWVRALEHPPEAGRPLRGWLATVMRNLWRQSQRGDARRAQRERLAARDEAQCSSSELVERVTTQRELVAAVLELEEPYRTTLLMRYFEELSPRRIAAREGIPVSTVKTRLARGLARLRARLDREHGGDGRTWILALAPVAARPEGAGLLSVPVALSRAALSSLSLGVLALNAKLVLSVVLLVAAGGTLLLTTRRAPAQAPRPEALAAAAERGEPTLEPVEARPAHAPAIEPAAAEPGRRAVAAPSTPAALPPAEPALSTLEGRVIDVAGTAVAGLAVRLVRPSALQATEGSEDPTLAWPRDGAAPPVVATAAADGSFRWSPEEHGGGGVLAVREPGWESVFAAAPRQGATVVVAPAVALVGSVVDEFGVPLEATVELAPPDGLRGRVGAVLDHSRLLRWSTRADAAGAFAFESLPALPDASVVARAEGYRSASEPLPQAGGRLVLVLRRPPLEGSLLRGEVVDGTGRRLAGARVALGFDTVVTDEDGLFRFDLAQEQTFNQVAARHFAFTPDRLLAVARGFTPAEYRPPVDAEGRPLWPDHVVLRVGGPTLSIAGRVLGTDGQPVAGAQVWIADPTFFGGLGDPARDRFPRVTDVETETLGAEPGWHWQETDASGRFRIDGLLERDYTLEAMLPDTLLRVVREGVPAGRESVELRFPADASYAVLRGRVVDQAEHPVPDVSVRPMCDAYRVQFQGQVLQTQHQLLDPVRTDAEGRFTLHDVPRDLVYLRLDGEDIVPLEWGRHAPGGLFELVRDEPLRVTIEVLRRCHFQVQLTDPEEADALMLLDARGDPLELSEFVAGGRNEGTSQPLIEGRSSVLSVGDGATWLVLLKDGETVRQAPVHLVRGETTVLRP